MDLGVFVFPTHDAMPPQDIARAVEQRGLESLFFPEHTHIPAARTTPYPGGGELPREYAHTLDLFVALTAAAVSTTRLKVGTGICLVVERDPIITAKEVASLDHLSGGRVLFGIGAGWNREEMANHGTDPTTRTALLAERVRAMQQIWTTDEASFSGEHVHFERIWSWPKPVQRPHPPILVGGNAPATLDRVVAIGDAWMPNRITPDRLGEHVAALQSKADAAGRGAIPVTIFGAKPQDVPAYAEAGVARCVLWLPSAGADQIEPRLDRYAEMLHRVA